MSMYTYYTLYLFSYLLGSIPFGLLFVKWSGGGDIRDIGSGNIGTTNVLRTGSKKLAAATLLADGLKGAIPVLFAQWLGMGEASVCGIAAMAILGHVFPLWLGFKGGKGVATAFGCYLAINPLVGLACLLTWGIVAKVLRISSLSALVAFFMAPLYMAVYGACFEVASKTDVIFMIIIYVVILGTHRENIRRIIKGEESLIQKK